MPTEAQVQNIILSAKARKTTLLQQNIEAFMAGFFGESWYSIKVLNLYTKAVQRQYNMGDYISANFLVVYDCLCKLLGPNVNGATIDPNFQNPNTTINIINEAGSVVTITKSQADLIDAGGGNFYLPFLDANGDAFATGVVPILLTVNGVGIPLQPDYTFTPMRLYGFSNNDTQVIELTVI